jgi:hypothetical protein
MRTHNPDYFMMKSFVLVATSIGCVLSVVNNADAEIKRSDRTITSQVSGEVSILTTVKDRQLKLTNSTISKSDLKSIHQAIVEFYRDRNLNYTPKDLLTSENFEGLKFEALFYEVKDYLKLVSIGERPTTRNVAQQAVVEATIEMRKYDATVNKNRNGNATTSLNKMNDHIKYKVKISLYTSLNDGYKWRVNSDTMIDGTFVRITK